MSRDARADRYLRAAEAVPPGETRSFQELAALAGRPGAARAAGRAVAGCPTASRAPWHRVVAADGALAKDAERARAQLRRLRREGARPRARESVAAWARRTGRALVGAYRRRRCTTPGDPRAARWDPERVEGFADEAAARARGFRLEDEPEPPPIPLPPPPAAPAATGATRAAAVAERLAEVDWSAVEDALRRSGCAHLPRLLEDADVASLLAGAHRPQAFDRDVDMRPRGFGVGRYWYWREPLPEPAQTLRRDLYARLRPLAAELLPPSAPEDLPATLDGFWDRCRAAGQTRPSSILLAYRAGGLNHPHRDIYGSVWFPLQALVVLSRRGRDFEGGDFVLVDDGPAGPEPLRAVPACAGDLVVFASRDLPPAAGGRRIPLRHGMRPVTRGARYALGLVFHLAR